MTVINIFRYTASVDALIWASALASLIAMVMFFVQCILSLREFMEVSSIVHSTYTHLIPGKWHDVTLSSVDLKLEYKQLV